MRSLDLTEPSRSDRESLIRQRCAGLSGQIRSDRRLGRVSHLRLDYGGYRLWDEHFGGPMVHDVFSVTKTVTATLVGVGLRRGDRPGIDVPLAEIAGATAAHPAGRQSLRHLLTMTRGTEVGGVGR